MLTNPNSFWTSLNSNQSLHNNCIGARCPKVCSTAVPVELIDVACGLLVCEELRMLGGAAGNFITSVVLAAAVTAAESDVQPSSASISAIDCSILAKVNSFGSAGCMSASGADLVSDSCTAAGMATGTVPLSMVV